MKQETNKDQIEELPAPSRIPLADNSPAVVFSTSETALDVEIVGQPVRGKPFHSNMGSAHDEDRDDLDLQS